MNEFPFLNGADHLLNFVSDVCMFRCTFNCASSLRILVDYMLRMSSSHIFQNECMNKVILFLGSIPLLDYFNPILLPLKEFLIVDSEISESLLIFKHNTSNAHLILKGLDQILSMKQRCSSNTRLSSVLDEGLSFSKELLNSFDRCFLRNEHMTSQICCLRSRGSYNCYIFNQGGSFWNNYLCHGGAEIRSLVSGSNCTSNPV